jgi:phosphomannomutase
MSAHHYFRDFAYCDSGMISWLLVAQLLCTSGKSLAEFVESRIKAYPCSGEINSKVADIKSIVAHVEDLYGKLPGATVKHIDGLSVEFNDWRFNLRGSNTEPILRLNVESKNNQQLMEEKTEELLAIIRK